MNDILYETAEVIEKREAEGGWVVCLKLFPDRDSAKCAGCASCFRNHRKVENIVTVRCDEETGKNLQVGKVVRISVEIPSLYVPIFVTFGLPILLMGLFVFFVNHFLQAESSTVFAALGGLLVAFLLIRTVFAPLLTKYERRITIIST
ncbi:MAG: SoxR reducing system RseC family protein [Planctomycetota bacterium]|nr:SoxR reducing system RseC family protein [Planctomycetota bacterium]